jgi:hypothetical protein
MKLMKKLEHLKVKWKNLNKIWKVLVSYHLVPSSRITLKCSWDEVEILQPKFMLH